MTSRTALPDNPFRSPERALPAQTRLDEYEIERVLAQSSFGVVYRAYDHGLRLHVAIKEYLPDALALRSAETQVVLRARSHAERFDQGLQAFIGEAQTLARCDHPSLLRILRVLQRHGTAYRVMRYTPGPTLLEHRRQLAAPPDVAAMRSWLDALLGALDALHEEGCVHGAVAPGNILLLHGGKPLLLDFDAVRTALISDRTQSMMAALEPCFEPPEQRERRRSRRWARGPTCTRWPRRCTSASAANCRRRRAGRPWPSSRWPRSGSACWPRSRRWAKRRRGCRCSTAAWPSRCSSDRKAWPSCVACSTHCRHCGRRAAARHRAQRRVWC